MKVSRLYAVPLAFLALAAVALGGAVLAENIDPFNDNSQFAWGENVGWLNAEPNNCSGCGVQVGATRLSGWMYGENIGWVNMSCQNNSTCAGPGGDWGVRKSATGVLTNYAWAENAGWISFSCQNNYGPSCTGSPGGSWGSTINLSTGVFSGYAWGENIGWISFSDTSPFAYKVQTSDADADGVDIPADNCPAVANAGQENNDTDAMGNACDDDDDDDGYVDADETLKASDPLVKLQTPEHCNGTDEDGDTVVDDEPPGGGYNWDTDGDTVKDCADASLDADGDTLPNTTDTDDDGDGNSDTVEVFVSTDPLDRCPDNTSDDAHPLDQDRNGSFNVSDILKYKGKTPASGMSTPKSAMYSRRLDIDGNGSQNVSDILKYKGKTPSACS